MSQDTKTLATTQPTVYQLAYNWRLVSGLVGKRTVLFQKSESHGIYYVSLRIVLDSESQLVATFDNGTITHVRPHAVNRDSTLIIEIQTLAYGRANNFVTPIGTLESRYVEHKSQTYYACVAHNGVVCWLAAQTKQGVREYHKVSTPAFFDTAHLESTLMKTLAYWLERVNAGKVADEDKRLGIVGKDITPYGAYLHQNKKRDSSMKAYTDEQLNAMVKALESNKALPSKTK